MVVGVGKFLTLPASLSAQSLPAISQCHMQLRKPPTQAARRLPRSLDAFSPPCQKRAKVELGRAVNKDSAALRDGIAGTRQQSASLPSRSPFNSKRVRHVL